MRRTYLQTESKAPAAMRVMAALTLVTLTPATLIQAWERQKAVASQVERAWKVQGPACQAAPPGWADAAPMKTFVVRDVGFSRHHGHIACTLVDASGGHGSSHYPVCQFTSPGVVKVEWPGGAEAYWPGAGKGATVTVRDGHARCVVASRPGVFR